MTFEDLDAYARTLPGVTVEQPFGPFPVYKVGGRMFALLGDEHLSFKATDIAFEVLVEEGRARPAPYLARAKWVAFPTAELADLDPEEVRGWLSTAHALVAAKLTRAKKRELGLA